MAIESIIIDVVIGIIIFLTGVYLKSIKSGITKVSKKVDIISDKVEKLETTVKEHQVEILEITTLNSIMARIDLKVRQSLEYLDKDDVVISAFIQSQGSVAKDCIEWAIHNHLKISEAEIRAKYEICNMEIRELLTKINPVFSNKVRPFLIEIAQHHINRTIQIAGDNLFNSKLDRFFTLTEQTVNEVLTTIVRTSIEVKMEQKLDKRI
jgi:hypothetical protein